MQVQLINIFLFIFHLMFYIIQLFSFFHHHYLKVKIKNKVISFINTLKFIVNFKNHLLINFDQIIFFDFYHNFNISIQNLKFIITNKIYLILHFI